MAMDATRANYGEISKGRWVECIRDHRALGALTVAADPLTAEQVAFFGKVRPLLVQHCYECHSGQAKQVKGGLLLDSPRGWAKGGDSGEPAIRPGKPEESLLLRAVRHVEAGLEMPPAKPKLAETAIADLVTWIKLGAPDPRSESTAEVKRADKTWWSLQPLAKASPSAAGIPAAWSPNEIDHGGSPPGGWRRTRPLIAAF
jgi:mono/diheme cytochrome c family protein